jgi:phage baseplate assembly protein W
MSTSFLGTGWSFPPEFTQVEDGVEMTSEELDIQKSLEVLLATRKGERVMLPDYGCNLDEMVFEPMTTTFKTYMREMIRTAIIFYEARINLNSVTIDDSRENEGVISISLDYTIRTTNSRFNFVYPYYKKEGTELK